MWRIFNVGDTVSYGEMMLIEFSKVLPFRLGRFLISILDKTILDKESPFIPPWLRLMYGIHLKRMRKGVYLASGFEEEVLVPEGGWRVFIEIFHYKFYEQIFNIENGEVVLDVGAHVGLFTMKARKAVGENGLVVAIEPEPKNAALLSENVRSHGFKNVVVVKKAAGNHKGKVKLYVSLGSRGHSLLPIRPSSIDVDMDTLDNIAAELGLTRVDFIKIDVEGAELDVLKGAEKILRMPNVKLAIAAYHPLPDGSSELQKISSYLKSKGMKIWTNDRGYVYAKTSS